MAYLLISDFRLGLDARRLAESAEPGTLRWLDNGQINSGGEIEKMQAFEEQAALSAALADARAAGGWVGPIRTHSGAFLFAGPGTRPAGLPGDIAGVPVYWSQLVGLPNNPAGLASFDVFADKAYLAVRMDNTVGVRHFYGAPGSPMQEVVYDSGAALPEPHVKTIASRMFRAQGSVLRYSAVNAPADVDTFEDGGLIDITTSEGSVGPIQGLGIYQRQLAIFGTAGAQIWTVDPDPSPSRTFLSDFIGGVSCLGAKTILTYDAQDLLFLTRTGVRSLRAQNISARATRDDLGTPVDELVRSAVLSGSVSSDGLAALTNQGALLGPPVDNMMSLIEPVTGQFWVIVGSSIFLFSRYQTSRVAAWAHASVPGGSYVRGAAAAQSLLLLCTENDKAFLYGGESRFVYDSRTLEARTPFFDMGDPFTTKALTGLDVVARGTWDVLASANPSRPDQYMHLATIRGSTARLHHLPVNLRGNHFSLMFRCADASTIPVLSRAALHYKSGARG